MAAPPPEQEFCARIASEGSCSQVGRNMVVAEDEENGADLELGLSLCAAAAAGANLPRRECCRILTAKDFPSIVTCRGSPISSSSSSASSPNLAGDGASGTKRDSDSPSLRSQVVGWPPIRAYRMNSMMNNSKNSSGDSGKKEDRRKNAPRCGGAAVGLNVSAGANREKTGPLLSSRFVKVNMDGKPIGRKVDLRPHCTYETLAMALQDMFEEPSLPGSRKSWKLMSGASEFVLTYEDKDGDWLLVGDVPWGMFVSSVKRLRIMRTSDARGLPTGARI